MKCIVWEAIDPVVVGSLRSALSGFLDTDSEEVSGYLLKNKEGKTYFIQKYAP